MQKTKKGCSEKCVVEDSAISYRAIKEVKFEKRPVRSKKVNNYLAYDQFRPKKLLLRSWQ